MPFAWAARFPPSSLAAALPLRLQAGVEAHVTPTHVWLRGPGQLDNVGAALRRVPSVDTFTVDAAGVLTPVGRRLPAGPMPVGPWGPFAALAHLRLPPAALPAAVAGRVPIRLIAADRESDPAALLVPLDAWVAYATSAPQVRLDRLRFAVRGDGTALVVGRPLPPIAGVVLTGDHGLLLPAGLAWHPPVDAVTLRRALALPDGDLALFDRDGSYQHIPAEMLVRATRAAVRRSSDT